jgi:hypothetical protein
MRGRCGRRFRFGFATDLPSVTPDAARVETFQPAHRPIPRVAVGGGHNEHSGATMDFMRAFEIHLNGKKLCVAGLEEGTLLFSVACGENKHGRGGIGLGMTGMLLGQSTVRWQQRSLRMNDEVRIKVIETAKVDKFKVLQKAPGDPAKYEKAYVRRMAKEFGWTIQSGAKGKKT